MKKRDLRLDKYGISKKRYKELCGFCEQYPEWMKQIKSEVFVSSVNLDGMPHNPNKGTSDQTGNAAIALIKKKENCALIEKVAKMASEEFWEYIIKSVCFEVPVTYLIVADGMPCSQSSFYEKRRFFFYLLDKEKGN
jgi:hypothetical protein